MQLLAVSDAGVAAVGVQRSLLMGILAIAQVIGFAIAKAQPLRKGCFIANATDVELSPAIIDGDPLEGSGNGRIVSRRRGECISRCSLEGKCRIETHITPTPKY